MTASRKVGAVDIEVSAGYVTPDGRVFECQVTMTLSTTGSERTAEWLEKNLLNLISEVVAPHQGVEIDWPHPDEME